MKNSHLRQFVNYKIILAYLIGVFTGTFIMFAIVVLILCWL